MEKEACFTGYCRTIDDSRMVWVVAEDGALTEVDCCYESCVHAPSCIIAQSIRQLLSECNL